jgi:hypothetical protein
MREIKELCILLYFCPRPFFDSKKVRCRSFPSPLSYQEVIYVRRSSDSARQESTGG